LRTLCAAVLFVLLAAGRTAAGGTGENRPLPEFDQPDADFWINSEPLTRAELMGHVAVVEVWTFGCVNCTRSLPWVERLQKRYGPAGLRIVGVHSPEFGFEKKRKKVRAFIEDNGITYPNLVDNDFAYWDRLGNRYWPAFYLVDRAGRIRHVHIGETQIGTERAEIIEKAIELLLEEPAPRTSP
jgi:thiol-disulfide isomerase/thioredoxin